MQSMQGYHMARQQVLAAMLRPLESSCMLTCPRGTGVVSLDSTERWSEAITGPDCNDDFCVTMLLPQCPLPARQHAAAQTLSIQNPGAC